MPSIYEELETYRRFREKYKKELAGQPINPILQKVMQSDEEKKTEEE